MKRFMGFVTWALLAMLLVVPAYAQQPGAANDPHHPGTSVAPPSKNGDLPMMDMCRQMMTGDMMGGPGPADPKDKADMLHHACCARSRGTAP